MTEFNQRLITNNETLGECLHRARLDARRSIAEVAEALRIRPEYIQALEQSNYTALPGDVFVKNYVRKYAKYLRLGRNTIEQLLQDELKVYQNQPNIPTTTQHLAKQPLQIRQVLIVLAVLFLIVGVGAYLSFAISNIIQPPELIIEPVPAKVSVEERFVTITGETAPEATVLINDQLVAVKQDGSFSQAMTVQPGINLFKIVAKTKRSKEHVEYQQVVVE